MAISPELVIRIAGNSQKFDAELKKLEAKALDSSKRMSSADDRVRKKALAENTRALEQTTRLQEKNIIASYRRIGIAVGVLAAGTALSVREFIKFEDALIGVIKTTDIAGVELEKFKGNIKDLSSKLGQSQESLLGIAETAGQLGVRGSDNLTKFTETIAKLNVASKTLQGEAAAAALSRILTITGEGFENVDRFASVIARLGDNFATTEAQIADMTLNIVQAGGVFKTSSFEAAGLGAAFSQLGIQSELARSTFTQFGVAIGEAFSKGGEKLRAFTAITGLTEEQLRKTFAESPTEVFQAFIKGLEQVIKSGGNAAQVLEIFGLANLRTLPVLTTAAKGHEEVARALGFARTEYQENTKLNQEFVRRTEATSFKIAQMKVELQNAAIALGGLFGPSIAFAAGNFAKSIDRVSIAFEAVGVIVSGLATIIAETFSLALGQMQDFAAKSLRLAAETLSKFGLDKTSVSLGSASVSLQATANKNLIKGADFFDGEGFEAVLSGETKQLAEARAVQAGIEQAHVDAVADIRAQGNQTQIAQNDALQDILDERKAEEDQKELEKQEEKREKELAVKQEQFDEDMEILEERLNVAVDLRDQGLVKELAAEKRVLQEKAKLDGLDVKREQALAKTKIDLMNTEIAAKIGGLRTFFEEGTAISKALFLVEKAAAIAETILNTQVAMSNAIANIPAPYGEVVAERYAVLGALSVATIAATTIKDIGGAAAGGVVPGGFGGGDRVPFMLEPGEIVVPQRLNPLSPNFDQTFGAGGGRGLSGISGGQDVRVMIGLEENASRILTVKQREDTALGIQR